ncbi:glucose-1-phosphate thymidylyltransferase [Xylanimonas oleitrophica]|uniref:Glucose-1-phosphate thymidylyltransferase n=1 Tax=Xylanimonas oleitrophica TaxID=2607479 RepID=A0A2W5WX63_9MICO|nr:inositol monophosphatase family protein [Xylanimonas oleitrophica]PZR52375.1 glucose-1-phosphate thymidylyltransferase [Xylanimonas oleitrophica]
MDTTTAARVDDSDLALALEVALIADRVSTGMLADGLTARRKSDGTDVTDVDLRVERVLVDLLRERRPGDAILSEECGLVGEDGAARRWVIDPVDGTADLLAGRVSWGTHIALQRDGRVVAAVVTRPVLGLRYWAGLGRGAYQDRTTADGVVRTSLRMSGRSYLDGARVATFVDPESAGEAVLRDRGLLADERPDVIGDLLRGDLDALLDEGGHTWDIAPLSLLVPEAGGVFAGPDGGPSCDMEWALSAAAGIAAELYGLLRPRAETRTC